MKYGTGFAVLMTGGRSIAPAERFFAWMSKNALLWRINTIKDNDQGSNLYMMNDVFH
jgi:hypothetical protein